MAIKIVSTVPHESVVKQAICKTCGVTLQFVPLDVIQERYSCMGDTTTSWHIPCVNCGHKVEVEEPNASY